jgi:hypothetical protein
MDPMYARQHYSQHQLWQASIRRSGISDGNRAVLAQYLRDQQTALAVVEAVRRHSASQYVLRAEVTAARRVGVGWTAWFNLANPYDHAPDCHMVTLALKEIVRPEHICDHGYWD